MPGCADGRFRHLRRIDATTVIGSGPTSHTDPMHVTLKAPVQKVDEEALQKKETTSLGTQEFFVVRLEPRGSRPLHSAVVGVGLSLNKSNSSYIGAPALMQCFRDSSEFF